MQYSAVRVTLLHLLGLTYSSPAGGAGRLGRAEEAEALGGAAGERPVGVPPRDPGPSAAANW